MRTTLLYGAVATWFACGLSGVTDHVRAEEALRQVPLAPKTGSYDLAPYRYVLTRVVANDGTVIQAGTLLRDGLPIAGSDFYRLELPIGSFIWYPAKPSVYGGGDQVGWIRINPAKKHPRWSMALIESNPKADAKVLRTVMRNPIPKKPQRPAGKTNSNRTQ